MFNKIKETHHIPNESPIFQQIKLANPTDIGELERLIVSGEDISQASLFKMTEIHLAVADEEIRKSINEPQSGVIYLYTNYLNDPKNNKYYSSDSPEAGPYIQQTYNKKLAHEMGHLQYRCTNRVEVIKWNILRDALAKAGQANKLCDDFSNNYGSRHCSKGPGHERNNPEGHACCGIEQNY